MIRVAALMPTRDRALTAYRAADSFLAASSRLPQVGSATLVIADDSSRPDEIKHLAALAAGLADVHCATEVIVTLTPARPAVTIASPGGGPGAARNAGLAVLQRACPEADVTFLLDDDVAFSDVEYRGTNLRCDGTQLLREAAQACATPRVIAGCAYVGRQDLSILEHVRLQKASSTIGRAVAPATERRDIVNVAPGEISTAFLAVAAPPTALPDFPEHYNEDYLWLHAFEREGWDLCRVSTPLIHAPPGDIHVTAPALSFQVFGEIVWLAVLERERFPVDNPDRMSDAVEEIAGDIRSALLDLHSAGPNAITEALAEVLDHYHSIGRQISRGELGPEAEALLDSVHRGLALRPPHC